MNTLMHFQIWTRDLLTRDALDVTNEISKLVKFWLKCKAVFDKIKEELSQDTMQCGPWVNIDDLGTEAGAGNGQSVQQHSRSPWVFVVALPGVWGEQSVH